MGVAVKICGLRTPEGIAAAVEGGARFVGFVFYRRSPRYVSPAEARELARRVPEGVAKVGVFVNPGDPELEAARACLDMIQLHGAESPERVAMIRARFARPVIKAIKLAIEADLEPVAAFAEVADWLMFDAKAPAALDDALPGGNARAFDWRLLARKDAGGGRPWLLSGGLTPGNVAEAIAIAGAEAVDVSSGVETRPGVKSVERIRAFLDAVAGRPASDTV
ncbi:MAG: phosphoribosylanthranilate isomerase [Proteobacteria bacterium]|nr:phosphoribosylanthranilate isomerase [Pseudomonadota bacterium]